MNAIILGRSVELGKSVHDRNNWGYDVAYKGYTYTY